MERDLPRDSVLVTLPSEIKYLGKSNIRQKGFVWGQSLRMQSMVAREATEVRLRAAGHIVPIPHHLGDYHIKWKTKINHYKQQMDWDTVRCFI